ncbi:MAG: polymer-forming cytoskeletal protein [Bacteroidota bacterium]
MFGNKKNESSTTKKNSIIPSTTSHALNSLVKGTTLEGTIKAETDFRVDGTIKGSLNCTSKLIIGPSGVVEGEVRCANAVIEGRFDGTLVVTELLHVKESAEVGGDVKTNKLIIQSGAVFNVTCRMGAQANSNHGVPKSPKAAKNLAKSTARTNA